jgi:hypothetical protein
MYPVGRVSDTYKEILIQKEGEKLYAKRVKMKRKGEMVVGDAPALRNYGRTELRNYGMTEEQWKGWKIAGELCIRAGE